MDVKSALKSVLFWFFLLARADEVRGYSGRMMSQLSMKISPAAAAESTAAFSRSMAMARPTEHDINRTSVVVLNLLNKPSEVDDPTSDGTFSSFCDVWDQQKDMLWVRIDSLNALLHRGVGAGETCPMHDVLILVEHQPVFTIGSSTKAGDIARLFTSGTIDNPRKSIKYRQQRGGTAEVVHVDRGGEATWHGPGQLVVYPILDLRRHRKDAHWYLRALEEIGIRACTWALLEALDRSNKKCASNEGYYDAERRLALQWGVRFGRTLGYTGCWLLQGSRSYTGISSGPKLPAKPIKVVAVGVSIKRWITQHGIAINCNCDTHWALDDIVPCGINDMPVGTLNDIAVSLPMGSGQRSDDSECRFCITPHTTMPHLLRAFSDVFSRDVREGEGRAA